MKDDTPSVVFSWIVLVVALVLALWFGGCL
jgi:hypothetical protein